MPFNVALVFEIKVLICVAAKGALVASIPNGAVEIACRDLIVNTEQIAKAASLTARG